MNTEKKDPQILIIGESHFVGILKITRLWMVLLAHAKRVSFEGGQKASDYLNEIYPFFKEIYRLVVYAEAIMKFEINYLKKYEHDEILVEADPDLGLAKRQGRGIEDFLELSERFFGKKFGEKMKSLFYLGEEYEHLYHSKTKRLEPRITDRIGRKIPFLVKGFREFFAKRRLGSAARRVLKDEKKLLVICGVHHSNAYYSYLKRKGYKVEVIRTPGGDFSQSLNRIDLELTLFCARKGVPTEIIKKIRGELL